MVTEPIQEEEEKLEILDEIKAPLETKSIQPAKVKSKNSFGTINLKGIVPKHFDFQLEEAASDLSLPVELIEELKSYGCQVDVYDPWVDPAEPKKWYKHGLIDDPMQLDKKYDSIVLAVAHSQFKHLSMDDYEKLSTKDPVLIDVKGIIEKPTWRL